MAEWPDRKVRPGSSDGRVWSPNSRTDIDIPTGWELVPTGDAGFTRRVRKAADSWWLLEEAPRSMYGKRGKPKPVGTYAPADVIVKARKSHGKVTASVTAAERRSRQERRDVEALRLAVLEFLDFSKEYEADALAIAEAASSAAKIGSGKVGRTRTKTLEERAELAARAHLRHTATDYDEALDAVRKTGAKRVTKSSRKYATARQLAHQQVDRYLAERRVR